MDTSTVRLAIKLSRREVAGLRATLREVQLHPEGLSDVGRIELDGEAFLTDPEIERLLGLLHTAADVEVRTASVAAIAADDVLQQLVREAYDHLLHPDSSPVDLRDWLRSAEPFVRS